jgi:PAS domain S-box-containing protein
MRRLQSIFGQALAVVWLTAALSGCSPVPVSGSGSLISESPFVTFREIPGVTEKEIEDIERLKDTRASLTYGMILSTEAFLRADGGVGGFTGLFCEWLSGLFDIPFVPQIVLSHELIEKLNGGEIDFSGNMMFTEARAEIYNMTDNIAERQLLRITVPGAGLNRIAQERPLRYMFIEGAPLERLVSAVLEPGTFEIVWAENYPAAYNALVNGEADAFIAANIANAFFIGYDVIIEDFIPLLFSSVTMAAVKTDPELESLISIVTKAQRSGALPYLTYLYNKGYQEYRRYAISSLLSEEELAYIEANPIIPIAAFNANYPLSFWDDRQNDWEGIFIDVLEEVSALTGLTFKVAHNEHTNMTVINQMLAGGEVFLLPNLTRTGEQEERFVWSEHVLLDDNFALISRSDFRNININEILHVTIGLARGTIYADMFDQWFPNHTNTVDFNGIDDALEALVRGEVEMVMTGQQRVLHLTHFQELPGYKANVVFNHPNDSRITFLKSEDVLRSIVDKALNMTNVDGIARRWTQRTYDYRVIVAEGQRFWLTIAIMLASAVLILTLIMFIRSRMMTGRINRQNRLLALANMENELQLTKLKVAVGAENVGLWEMEFNKDETLKPDGTVFWSDEIRLLLGYENEYDFPNLVSSFIGCAEPEVWEQVAANLAAHILDRTGKTPFNMEYRLRNKDGDFVYFHASCETIRDADGNPVHVAGALNDITYMKELIGEAERQRKEAETANKAKSEFLSHISHEIRTPMNAVLGTAEIHLQKEGNAPETEEAFNIIYGSGNLLLNIINDILDLSKIEAGKLELVEAPYDIPSLIYDTVQLNLLRYESKPIEFDLKISENTPHDLLGDELRIKQILNNILSNAFKYTDKGRVELSVGAETGPEGECVLILRVSDTGQGMTEEETARLFEEYTRFNMDANRAIVGTGLGMHITKRLLDVMEGDIFVESQPEIGSVFTVRLPQKRIGTDICGPRLAERLRSSRFKSVSKLGRSQVVHEHMPYGSVLIVDDVESNLYVAKGMMLPYGMKIDTAVSGFEALDKIKNGEIYDVIFMDHMMPKMNGMETTKILRDMGYDKPIVALTANAVAGSSEMFLANGFDGYISKPIDIRELNSSLNRFLRDKKPVRSPQIGDELTEAVVLDIRNALVALDEILSNLPDADIELYTTTVHGIKSALANIGETELSSAAYELEKAGDQGELDKIASQTPGFADSLRELIEKLGGQAG